MRPSSSGEPVKVWKFALSLTLSLAQGKPKFNPGFEAYDILARKWHPEITLSSSHIFESWGNSYLPQTKIDQRRRLATKLILLLIYSLVIRFYFTHTALAQMLRHGASGAHVPLFEKKRNELLSIWRCVPWKAHICAISTAPGDLSSGVIGLLPRVYRQLFCFYFKLF